MDFLRSVLVCLRARVFRVAVAYCGFRITAVGESSGTGGKCSLAMITWGVRAIETETAHIAPQVTALNGALSQVAAGLKAICGALGIPGSLAAAHGEAAPLRPAGEGCSVLGGQNYGLGHPTHTKRHRSPKYICQSIYGARH